MRHVFANIRWIIGTAGNALYCDQRLRNGNIDNSAWKVLRICWRVPWISH